MKESEVSQTFDLKEILGVSVSNMPEVKEAIGEAFIQKIIERTESGEGVDGKKFTEYSNEYADSLAFKAFGKKKNKVNLTQTGSMLGTLDIVESKGNKIKIGWDDDTENAKAYNHNTGDTITKRAFFGITDDDIKAVSKEFKPNLLKESNDEVLTKKLDQIAKIALGIEDDDF
jgi:hypothetical protein